MNQGDRLAFSNGIIVLSVFAAVLIVGFRGDTQSLLPLYMIGVFISFTLSQAGMVIHWRRTERARLEDERAHQRLRRRRSRPSCWSSSRSPRRSKAPGSCCCSFRSSSPSSGRRGGTTTTWPSQLTLRGYTPQRRVHNTVIVPIGGIQRAVVEALRYGETLSDDVRGDLRGRRSGGDRADQARLGHVGRHGAARRAATRRTDR